MSIAPSHVLVYVIRDGEILLGYKKRGMGHGKMVGIGGKCEVGEDPDASARREVLEEIGIETVSLTRAVVVDFVFPDKPTWNIHAYVYRCDQWKNEPIETDEIRPQWYALDAIPYDKMWDDARYMIPYILQGRTFHATYTYSSVPECVVQFTIRFTDSL